MKLLLVDDIRETRIRETRDFFRFAFELEGIQMRLASNGSEAIELVQQERFDVIVMDVEMPQMNGWDAVRQMRQMPNGADVPILLFSAYCDDNSDRESVAVGADTLLSKPVLPKPVLPRELLTRIEKVIDKHRDNLDANPMSLRVQCLPSVSESLAASASM